MIYKKKILNKNFKPDERLLFSKVLDQVFICYENHINTFTKFLDPYKVEKFSSIIKENLDIKVYSYGGTENCERRKLGFCQNYTSLSNEDFLIKALEIKYISKFKKLNHQDFLGSILGLGVDRSNIGDIIILYNSSFVFVNDNIAEFIYFNLKYINKVKVDVIINDNMEDICIPFREFEKKVKKISSIRLDNVISSIFNISRNKACELIKSKKAYVNWSEISNTSYSIKKGDIITLRGYGRIKIEDLELNDKNNNYHVGIYIYK